MDEIREEIEVLKKRRDDLQERSLNETSKVLSDNYAFQSVKLHKRICELESELEELGRNCES